MTRRRILTTCGLVLGLVLLGTAVAEAASDLYGNVGPGQSLTGLAGRYPLSAYSLDHHFDTVSASLTGGVDASGVPPTIAYFLADVLWQLTAFLANALITLFTFAFSLDLLNGSPDTGGSGALAPVAAAIQGMYQHTFGQPWLVIAVVLAGCWAMWKALVQRRYTETAGALAMSLAYCVIALAIVSQPAQTIGQVSKWTNQMSTAFLSITTSGQVTGSPKAKEQVADSLFRLMVYDPWVALNFGGTQHCVRTGTGSAGHDPTSVPVRPLAASARAQLDAGQNVTTTGKACVSNTARYPAHFLKYPDASDERNSEYDAVNQGDPGKLPQSDQSTAYKPVVGDKPVTDAMEKGGQYQRLLLAVVIFIGELGMILLLGALSVSVIIAQVLVLLLACFAPVALVLGVIPGRGHEYFRSWLSRLGSLLIRKAAYSLVLAVLLAVMSALQSATAGLGWLMAFGLQAALTWTVFIQRKQLAGKLTVLASGPGSEREENGLQRALSVYYGGRMLSSAVRHMKPTSRPAGQPADESPPLHNDAQQPPPVSLSEQPTASPGEGARSAELDTLAPSRSHRADTPSPPPAGATHHSTPDREPGAGPAPVGNKAAGQVPAPVAPRRGARTDKAPGATAPSPRGAPLPEQETDTGMQARAHAGWDTTAQTPASPQAPHQTGQHGSLLEDLHADRHAAKSPAEPLTPPTGPRSATGPGSGSGETGS